MKSSTFTYKDRDGVKIFVYKWQPRKAPKAAVQIAHGLAEHAARYKELAEFLTEAGYVCYADDHRGHGKTAGGIGKVGILGPGGWDGTVNALKALTDIIKKENAKKPLFFVGHSWGSMLGQDYIEQWGRDLEGAVLVGTNAKQPFTTLFFGGMLARMQLKKLGPDTPSELLDKLTFGSYNKPYEPAPTKFEWLSRDRSVVDAYVADPYCGFLSTTGMAVELIYGVKKIARKEHQEKIPRDLPVCIMTGARDPSNGFAKGARVLCDIYKKLGIRDVELKVYPGARHEIFNETNRMEVFEDLRAWLDGHLQK
ncbi:MAG: alpha/beta hydrolase [Spirochaetes bacterium]|jgi:alpha-beta hydrolase superfamily lysophospholipase|nr:alpha/beta hydrolase [Spirochaetota bacterium]